MKDDATAKGKATNNDDKASSMEENKDSNRRSKRPKLRRKRKSKALSRGNMAEFQKKQFGIPNPARGVVLGKSKKLKKK